MAFGSKQYQPWSPMQSHLLPPSPKDWLVDDHPVYFILDVVNELNIGAFERMIRRKDARGQRPFNPRMMLALLLYSYSRGVYSSRRIARSCLEDISVRVLVGGAQPHFTVINEFRKAHQAAFQSVFLQALRLCQEAGMVKLGHVALDGTKIKADAGKHKAMSYKRMLAEEERLKQELAAMLSAANTVNEQEDVQYGIGVDSDSLPEELRRRESRLEKIREAREQLEAQAKLKRASELRANARSYEESAAQTDNPTVAKRWRARAKNDLKKASELVSDEGEETFTPTDDVAATQLPAHQIQVTVEGLPREGAQANFTDPESRIMKGGDGAFVQGYNAQAAVDDFYQVIVAADVTNQAPDNGNLIPMLAQIAENLGQAPEVMTADSGYWQPDAPKKAHEYFQTEALIAIGATDESRQPQHVDSEASTTSDPRTKMRDRLKEEDATVLYRRRKATVEPVFGQIKECRGFRQFSLRGVLQVAAEWQLIAAVHNLTKLRLYRLAV